LVLHDEVLRAVVEALHYIYLGIRSNPYAFVFLVSAVGNSIPYAAVPYYLVLIYLSHVTRDPLGLALLALSSGLGSTAGKLVIYLIGRGISRAISEERRRNIEAFGELIKRWGFVFVLIATSTPLPDDVVLIPIAFAGYSIYLYFTATLIGKSIASLMIVFFGRGLSTAVEDVGLPQHLQIPILLGISVALMIIIVRIDWISVVREYQVGGVRGAASKIYKEILGSGLRLRGKKAS